MHLGTTALREVETRSNVHTSFNIIQIRWQTQTRQFILRSPRTDLTLIRECGPLHNWIIWKVLYLLVGCFVLVKSKNVSVGVNNCLLLNYCRRGCYKLLNFRKQYIQGYVLKGIISLPSKCLYFKIPKYLTPLHSAAPCVGEAFLLCYDVKIWLCRTEVEKLVTVLMIAFNFCRLNDTWDYMGV